MKAYIFPGQGSQYPGMGADLYQSNPTVKAIFDEADQLAGFSLSKAMFEGTEEELKQTKVTQPAIFLHSIALVHAAGEEFQPDMVAGHSLGEFSALASVDVLPWQQAFKLVALRAKAMQKACELVPSTMAAILGLDDNTVDETCKELDGTVVAANFNCPGQVVISGEVEAVDRACQALLEKGAKRAIKLNVGGAFHSPLMEPAREELAQAIHELEFAAPRCPIYQNVDALENSNPQAIKQKLVKQLTAPVMWTQTVRAMYATGAALFVEAGPGNVLGGLVRKVERDVQTASLEQLVKA